MADETKRTAKCPKCGKLAHVEDHPTIPHIAVVACPTDGPQSIEKGK